MPHDLLHRKVTIIALYVNARRLWFGVYCAELSCISYCVLCLLHQLINVYRNSRDDFVISHMLAVFLDAATSLDCTCAWIIRVCLSM